MSTASVREKIINAALDLFSQKGYDATSVDEIAESIGMKGPNIYKYFKGKEEVLKELSVKMEEGYRQRMKMNPEEGANISNRDELKAYSMNQIKFTKLIWNVLMRQKFNINPLQTMVQLYS